MSDINNRSLRTVIVFSPSSNSSKETDQRKLNSSFIAPEQAEPGTSKSMTHEEIRDISYYSSLLGGNELREILNICKKHEPSSLREGEGGSIELDFTKLSYKTLRVIKEHVLKCLNRESFSPPPEDDDDSDDDIVEVHPEDGSETEESSSSSSEMSVDLNTFLSSTNFKATNGTPLNVIDIFQGLEYCDLVKSAIQHDDIPSAVDFLEKMLRLLKEGIIE